MEKKSPTSAKPSTQPKMGCPSDEPLTIPASLLGEYWSLVILFFPTYYIWLEEHFILLTIGKTHKSPLKIWSMSL